MVCWGLYTLLLLFGYSQLVWSVFFSGKVVGKGACLVTHTALTGWQVFMYVFKL